MAITINGTGTITGISAGGLPDGSVTAADIESSLDLTGKTVTLPSGTGGKILRVVNTVKTDTFSTASQSYTVVTGLTATITPRFNDSKILIIASVHFSEDAQAESAAFALGKDGSVIDAFLGAAAGNRPRAAMHGFPSDGAATTVENGMFSSTVTCLDSPASTSQITYSVMMRTANGGLMYVNRTKEDRDSANYDPRTISTLTLMEIAA